VSQTSTVARSGAAPAATAVAVPPGAAPAAPPPQTPPPARGRLRRAFEGTPGKLRTAAVVGVLVSLVFALVGGNAFRARGDALDQARDAAAQLVRVQQIATDLTSADAVVTNAFLQSGQEPPGAYETFQKRISDASTKITEAAKAEPGDAAALSAVNQALARYTADVSAARVNNRLGYQVGSGYLRQASALLRTPSANQPAMLPTLQNVVTTDSQRVEDAFGAARLALVELAIAALVVLGGLAAVQIWLGRRTRRVFNLPMTWGSGAVVVTIVLGALVMIGSVGSANAVHDTSYAATKALAQARIYAYDAKANESLTLVYQGSGQQYEKAYQDDLAIVRSQLDAAGRAGVADPGQTELAAWDTAHKAIRSADDAGNWGDAVGLATSSDGAATTSFEALATKTGNALENEATAVESGLGASLPLVVLGWLTLLVGIAAAALAWAGIQQRLEEYR